MKQKGSMGKHNSLVDLVEEELKFRGYTEIYKNTTYSNGLDGEIDIYAVKNNYILNFEIKCNHTNKAYKKAKDQLSRATRYYHPRNSRVFNFYVHGDCKQGNNIYFNWIKSYK